MHLTTPLQLYTLWREQAVFETHTVAITTVGGICTLSKIYRAFPQFKNAITQQLKKTW